MTDVSVAEAIAYLKELVRKGYDENHLMAHYSQAFRNGAADQYETLLEKAWNPGALGLDRVTYIAPSDDATGATDWQNIQDAVDYNNPDETRAIWLAGTYYINKPIQMGVEGDLTAKRPVSLIGQPYCAIRWAGGVTDDYMIRIVGWHQSTRMFVQNVMLYGAFQARGILASFQAYYPRFENIRIWRTLGSGIDICGCWASSWNNIVLLGTRGAAIRANAFNSVTLSNVSICNNTMWHADDATVWNGAATIALLDYAMANGYAAAKAHYGDDLVEGWPADDDDKCWNYTEEPWNYNTAYPPMYKASVMIHGNCLTLNNLAFESGASIDHPLLDLSTETASVDTVRFENNQCRLNKIILRRPSSDSNKGHCNRISGLHVHDGYGARFDCETVVRFVGACTQNTISHAKIRGITEAFATMEVGSHQGNQVSQIYSVLPVLGYDKWLVTAGGGTNLPLSMSPSSTPVFATAAARDTAWPNPVAGWTCLLADTEQLTVYTGTSWLAFDPVSGTASP